MSFVLDSFAVLAHLEAEPGGGRVREVLEACRDDREEAYLSMMNVGEVAYITERERGPSAAARALGLIDLLPLVLLPVSRQRILAAAHVKANASLSYADAFVVAAAWEFEAVILTGDPEFRSVEGEVGIEWLDR